VSLYAVVGNPVSHSKSPRIHTLFAEQTGQDIKYEAIQVEEKDFDKFVRDFFVGAGAGLNVTVPYKERAFAIAEKCSPRATLARAVNTLSKGRDNQLNGDNTDGIGLVRDIKSNHQFDIEGKKILLLGAGGAVRGALAALVNEQPAAITILNRTLSRAQQLIEEFKQLVEITARDYEGLIEAPFDLIINGTSLSLTGELPAIDKGVIAADCCCYDMMYGAQDTPFVSWAKNNGAALALDGLGMLVEQAAESFAIWRGVRPETAPVIERLRKNGQ